MGQIVPDAVEGYLASLNRLIDPVLEDIAADGVAQKLPLVDSEVGALLQVLATAVGARRALEIGTAIGYSTIWLARALPEDGMLLSMELDPERAAVARRNIERAGMTSRVSVMIGDAQRLIAKVAGPFDVIFQDGSKRLYVPLLDQLVDRLRPGGILITDNVLWGGEVIPGFSREPMNDPEDTRAIAEYNLRLAAHPELATAVVPLRDGVAISVKRATR